MDLITKIPLKIVDETLASKISYREGKNNKVVIYRYDVGKLVYEALTQALSEVTFTSA